MGGKGGGWGVGSVAEPVPTRCKWSRSVSTPKVLTGLKSLALGERVDGRVFTLTSAFVGETWSVVGRGKELNGCGLEPGSVCLCQPSTLTTRV